MKKLVLILLLAAMMLAACGDDSPKQLAQETMAAVESLNAEQQQSLSCSGEIFTAAYPAGFQLTFSDIIYQQTGLQDDWARVNVTGTMTGGMRGQSRSAPFTFTIEMQKQGQDWCVTTVEGL